MPGIAMDGSEDLPWESAKDGVEELLGDLSSKIEHFKAPKLNEELYRKTFESLAHFVDAYRIGRITEEQFSTAIDAIFMTVGGLVPDFAGRPKFIEVITECKNESTAIYPIVKRAFFGPKNNSFKVFTWQAGDPYVKLSMMTSTGMVERKVEYPDAATARDKLNEMADPHNLKKMGFVEL